MLILSFSVVCYHWMETVVYRPTSGSSFVPIIFITMGTSALSDGF